MSSPLQKWIESRTKGKQIALLSVCSSNRLVIEACMEFMRREQVEICFESTANQVDQNGGYSGMRPIDYARMIRKTAVQLGVRTESVLMGGDHLGPLTWRSEREHVAMQKAVELVRAYVLAGYSKIHIDTTMSLDGDDPAMPLPLETIARRTAVLIQAAEDSFGLLPKDRQSDLPLFYIIGSDVPVPGGARDEQEHIDITTREHAKESLEAFRHAFIDSDLANAWERVVAMVVQPGVEFDGSHVFAYSREAAASLTGLLTEYPGLVFEGHSTDYQTRECLCRMVEDGIAVLKVGPALTFALREALFGLSAIESEIVQRVPAPSRFRDVLEEEMLRNPSYWRSHYIGTEAELHYMRAFSLLDRSRYYLMDSRVEEARRRLFCNLDREGIPMALVSQYFPVQYRKVRDGLIPLDAMSLAKDAVQEVLEDYRSAVQPTGSNIR